MAARCLGVGDHGLGVHAPTDARRAGFKVGDSFVASGYINEYDINRNGQTQTREEFVARRIGHDLGRTKYEIDRTPSRQPEPPNADLSVAKESAPVVGL